MLYINIHVGKVSVHITIKFKLKKKPLTYDSQGKAYHVNLAARHPSRKEVFVLGYFPEELTHHPDLGLTGLAEVNCRERGAVRRSELGVGEAMQRSLWQITEMARSPGSWEEQKWGAGRSNDTQYLHRESWQGQHF